MVSFSSQFGVATLALNDPARRNALSPAMFDSLDAGLERIRTDDSVRAVLLRGEGPAFCAGFDLGAVVEQPSLMATLIERLSRTLRAIRGLPQPVVAGVHGAAIAGGCAILSACDVVFVESSAKLGYPVHRIGVSPAVTLPALIPFIGAGAARALVMSGDLIDGREAQRIGLATRVVSGVDELHRESRALAEALAAKPAGAVRVTKRWLAELDQTMNDGAHEAAVAGSVHLACREEAIGLLRAMWPARNSTP